MRPHPLLPAEFLRELGIVDWGYTEDPVPVSFERFSHWTEREDMGPLTYLTDKRFGFRQDLRNFYPEFRSSLVFLFSYQPAKKRLLELEKHAVAAYALAFEGEDYHRVLKRRLTAILNRLQAELPGLGGVLSLDREPVLERDLAFRAGLGWFGKNSMLISRQEGSYFLIGSLLFDQRLGLPAGVPVADHCGACTACADACPTNAIDLETRTIRPTECISAFTIEIPRAAPPPAGLELSRGEAFGCDICQDICPWNKKPLERVTGALPIKERFQLVREWFLEATRQELRVRIEAISNRAFLRLFDGTALARPGRPGWLKNLRRER